MRLTELASDREALRTDIADELLAINRYEQQTFTLTDEETRETVARILDERKQHVALLLGQLRRLDPKQREKLDR
jgi:rubrerythrin